MYDMRWLPVFYEVDSSFNRPNRYFLGDDPSYFVLSSISNFSKPTTYAQRRR